MIRESSVSKYSLTFLFLNKREDETTHSALNQVDVISGGLNATPTLGKAPTEYVVSSVILFLEELGYNEVILQTDQEPAILALAEAIAKKRTKPIDWSWQHSQIQASAVLVVESKSSRWSWAK